MIINEVHMAADMNPGCLKGARESLCNATLVFDQFDVVSQVVMIVSRRTDCGR